MQKESELEKQCIDYLKVVTCNNSNITGWKVKPGAQLHSIKGKVIPKPSTMPGFPDILVCSYGLFIGIELKTNTGRQSENQRQCQKRIMSAGGKYFLVRSFSEFTNLITILLQNRIPT